MLPSMLSAADHLEIQRLYAAYNNAIAAGDSASWASCFIPGGVFSNRSRSVRGHADLEGYAAGFMAGRGTRYLINNLVLEPDGAGARGTCYLVILRLRAEGVAAVELTGVYSDSLVRHDARGSLPAVTSSETCRTARRAWLGGSAGPAVG